MKRPATRIYKRVSALLICSLLITAAGIPSYAAVSTDSGDDPEKQYEEMFYDGTPGCMQIGEPEGTAELVPEEKIDEPVVSEAASSEGSSVYIAYNGKWINYDSYLTPMFTARTETGTYIALCAQPDTKQPPDGATWTVSTIDNDLLKSILLLTPGNELYQYHGDNIFTGASEDEKYAYVHALLGLVYQGSLTGLTEQHVREVQALLETIRGALESDDQFGAEWRRVIGKYRLYIAYTGEPYQDVLWAESTAVKLSVQKASSDDSYKEPLSGAVFAIYDSEENAKEAQRTNAGKENAELTGKEIVTLTTKDDGSTAQYEVGMGEYWAYEIRAPRGYLRNEECAYINADREGGTYVFSCSDEPSSGNGAVIKTSADPGITEGNRLYSMKGIEYTVYTDKKCTSPAKDTEGNEAVILLDEDGTGNIPELTAGTYYVKETGVPENCGYIRSEEVKALEVSAGKTASVEFENDAAAMPIGLLLRKKDAETGAAQGNASLEGAEYTISYYDDLQGEGDPVRKWVFKTDADGIICFDSDHKVSGSRLYSADGTYVIPAGTVKIRETKAPEGYLLSGEEYTVHFYPGENGTMTCDTGVWNTENNCQDTDILSCESVIKGGVKFSKIDAETGGMPEKAGATLEGAQITIYNNSTAPVKTGEVTAEAGEAVAAVVTDSHGNASTAADLLPYGSYYAKETVPPDGYVLNTEWRADFVITEEGVIVDKTDEGSLLPDRIARADIRILKLDIDGSGMAGIPFMISLLDENGQKVESHTAATDENGCLDTSRRPKTGESVNSLDQYVSENVFTEESMLTGDTGVWFGEQTARAEGRGSLICGRYLVEELSCQANQGMELLSRELFFDEGTEGEAFEDGRVYDLSRTFINLRIHPESDLVDDASGSKTVSRGENVAVTDLVHFDHLKVGTEYMVRTEIYYVDAEGISSLIGQNIVNFIPEAVDETETSCGTVASRVQIDTSELENGYIAAADTFYVIKNGTYYELASHNGDLTEERQMLLLAEKVTPTPTPEETPEPTPEKTPGPTPEETPEPTPVETPETTVELTPVPVIQTGDINDPVKWAVLLAAGAAVMTAALIRKKSGRGGISE